MWSLPRVVALTRFLNYLLLALLIAACERSPANPPLQPLPDLSQDPSARLLVGAHYYLWYPTNFRHGYLRARLNPPQSPVLGEYESADRKVIDQHIRWASQYGIDFFTLDWWPSKPERQKVIDSFISSPLIEDLKFCIFYETWDLGFSQTFGATTVEGDFSARLRADVKNLAARYFDHPSYLRVGGRPVIVFYLTRTLVGDYQRAFSELREELREELRDYAPIFIGDEIFWFGIEQLPGKNPELRRAPLPDRIALFDAITAYNYYESTDPTHAGYAADSSFIPDIRSLLALFRTQGSRPIIPSVVPGYNDRGVRPRLKHYPIPRQFSAGGAEGSLLERMIEEVALPFVDARLPMLLVTSWNEWNEDTAIEPLELAPATAKDGSESTRRFTDGFSYIGHGEQYLKTLQKSLIPVHGQLADETGRPRGRVWLELYLDGQLRARTRTDAAGFYNFSRLHLRAGRYEIRHEGKIEREGELK